MPENPFIPAVAEMLAAEDEMFLGAASGDGTFQAARERLRRAKADLALLLFEHTGKVSGRYLLAKAGKTEV